MAIPLTNYLETSEQTGTIVFAENITDSEFNHENMTNELEDETTHEIITNTNKQTVMNEYFYQRSIKPYFIVCGTVSDNAAKAVIGVSGINSDSFKRKWPLLRIKFTHTNTASSPTLNINNLGAYPIYYNGTELTTDNANILNGIVTLMYNGTTSGSEYWDFISGDTTTFTSADNILHGSSSGSEITYAPYSSETADSTWVGTDGNGGKLYLGDIDPSKTNRLNLNGYLYAKRLYSDGTEVKVKQDAVSDPSANGNSTSFIATISQDTNGVITVTKKNLGTATINTAGAIKVGAVKNSAVTNASTDDTNTEKRYSVLIDSTGLAYTNVPWTDTNTTYSSGNEITINNSNAINHNVKLSGGFTPTTTGVTISGYGASGSFKIPVLTVNDYGHVTNASEATVSITLPDNKITSYNAPTYDTAHVSPTYQAVINANVITTNMVYDTAINKLDYKIAGLTKEVIDDEATLSQAIEDEPRYYAKSSTAAGTATKIATLVESRNYNLINGTKVTVYFSTANTANNPILVNVNNTGAKVLIYNDDIFDGSLIENGTTLEMVYDDDVNFVVGESPNTTTYTECYRVVGGVGSGSGSGCSGALTADIEVNNPIGLYTVGDIIEAGTCLEEIIRYMLCVVIDVISHLPSLSWSWNPTTTVEVGTTVTPVQNASGADGYFSSADTTRYPDSTFNTNNNTTGGRLSAGCAISGTGYGITYPTSVTMTTEGDNTFTATLHYGDSTNVPKKSDNTNSSVSISEGNATASKNVYWRYKAFYGFTAYVSGNNFNTKYNGVTFSNIRKADGTQGCEALWCNKGSTDTIISSIIASNSSYTTLILLLPSNHSTITWTETPAQPGTDVHDNWDIQYSSGTTPATLTRTVNGTSITYYIYAVDNQAVNLEQKNIKFH